MGGATEHWVAMGAQYLLHSKSYIQRSTQSHRPVHNVLTVGHSARMTQTHPHLTTYVSCLALHMCTWGQATCLQVASLSCNMLAILTAQLHMHIAALALEAMCDGTLACSEEVNYAQCSTSHVAVLALQALDALCYCLPTSTVENHMISLRLMKLEQPTGNWNIPKLYMYICTYVH